MVLDNPLLTAAALEQAMDPSFLRVRPDTPVSEVIAAMSQLRIGPEPSRAIADVSPEPEGLPLADMRSSCALVLEDGQPIGIFTERDIVRLTAAEQPLANLTMADVMAQPVITLPQDAVQDIFAILFLFRRYRIRHLPIVTQQGTLLGIVSPASIRQVLRPANLLKQRRVADVMSKEVVQAKPTASVLQLAQQMANHQVSCVVISVPEPEGGVMPIGIVTERDIVQFQALQLDLTELQAETVMSMPLFLLSPQDSLWTAHQEMQRRRTRRLVVSWNWGMGLGIITQTSLLRVFDPVEMYGVIESLQQSGAAAPVPPAQPRAHPPAAMADRLLAVQTALQAVVDQPDLSPGDRQQRLQNILAELTQIQQTQTFNLS